MSAKPQEQQKATDENDYGYTESLRDAMMDPEMKAIDANPLLKTVDLFEFGDFSAESLYVEFILLSHYQHQALVAGFIRTECENQECSTTLSLPTQLIIKMALFHSNRFEFNPQIIQIRKLCYNCFRSNKMSIGKLETS